MAFFILRGFIHGSGGRSIRILITTLVLALVLAGCGLAGPGQRTGPMPTLVPTLALAAMPTAVPPQPSATFASETPDAPPADTVTPAAADLTLTDTLTPWVQDTITPGPSPTATRTPTMTRIPTRTRVPSKTPTITPTPTVTFTPTPPEPALYLARPGLMSKVLSPIQMELYAVVGGDSQVTIELVGEDGRVISRKVVNYDHPNRHVWLAPTLPFEIEAAAETARLQVSTLDLSGRMEWLTSTDVLLLSVGRAEINPPAITQEPFLIREPEEDTEIGSGMLHIEALARPVNNSPLIIELTTENGAVISTKQLIVPPPTGELSHTPFTVDIPYKVDAPTPVRLSIRQEGSRIPGTVALVSETLILNP